MQSHQHTPTTRHAKRWLMLIGIALIVGLTASLLSANSTNIRRISLGSGSLEGDGSSFHLFYGATGDLFVYQSYATNWHPNDPKLIKQDVFIRDETTDTTWQVTFGADDSFEPTITRDGRYVAFTSYAGDLVPNDNNTTSIWIRDGLDLFLFDRMTASLERVSLNSQNREIKGNSIGLIAPTGEYVVFLSNGTNVIHTEGNGARNPALYIRDWRTGDIERITYGIESPDAFPNGAIGQMTIDATGRYIAFVSEASNLVPNDTNGVMDVFLYDTVTKTIKRVSQPANGNANGESARPQLSRNGEIVTFHSDASNLVPNDTNGVKDIFVYTTATGTMERISVSTAGVQGNGLSREPATCESGRFIAYTTEATNLIPNDNNGYRDIMVRDRVLNETFVVSKSDSGVLGNGRAHRVTMTPDCKTVGFASDATNFIPNDNNNMRDLYSVTLLWPQFEMPTAQATGNKAAGETVTLTYNIRNSGTEAGSASFALTLPSQIAVDGSSLTGGATLNGNSIEWSGTVSADSSQTISFDATIDAGISDFAVLAFEATLVGGGETAVSTYHLPINGADTFLPMIQSD